MMTKMVKSKHHKAFSKFKPTQPTVVNPNPQIYEKLFRKIIKAEMTKGTYEQRLEIQGDLKK
jgi:hypothetical protein